MQDTKTKTDINLIQFHKITSRHVLVLEADISECDKRKLLHMSNIIRIAGNKLIAVMKKQYEQLLRTKRYRRPVHQYQHLSLLPHAFSRTHLLPGRMR